jgi:mutator protein MutT
MKVVAAVIKSKDGFVLITQRGKGMHFEGKWEFPGGKIEDGESPVEALKREIYEELGIHINVKEKVLEWSYEYPFGKVDFIAYNSEPNGGKLVLMEHMDSKWVNIHELKDFVWVPADVTLVDELVGGNV